MQNFWQSLHGFETTYGIAYRYYNSSLRGFARKYSAMTLSLTYGAPYQKSCTSIKPVLRTHWAYNTYTYATFFKNDPCWFHKKRFSCSTSRRKIIFRNAVLCPYLSSILPSQKPLGRWPSDTTDWLVSSVTVEKVLKLDIFFEVWAIIDAGMHCRLWIFYLGQCHLLCKLRVFLCHFH